MGRSRRSALSVLFAPRGPRPTFGHMLARTSGRRQRVGNTPFVDRPWTGASKRRR